MSPAQSGCATGARAPRTRTKGRPGGASSPTWRAVVAGADCDGATKLDGRRAAPLDCRSAKDVAQARLKLKLTDARDELRASVATVDELLHP